MRRLAVATAACAAALTLVLVPVAGADDDWTVKWSNGHRIESADKAFSLKFGGRIQADYNLALALNWYLNPATRMMLDWVHADVDDLGEADFIVLRWQVDF